jgi:tetratricopeptide (TPR) repeat protein
MRRMFIDSLLGVAVGLVLMSNLASAGGQMNGMGGQGGGPMGRGGTTMGGAPPGDEIPNTPPEVKPDAAAKKAFAAGTKSLNKAKDFAAAAASAPNEDKKNAALEKKNDAYGRALDQFTEALSNNGDMYEAWNNVGYIHLELGAYAEAVDDYNHTLKLKPDLPEAILHRAQANLAIDRLDDTQAAYMDLFNHERPLADELMASMQKWVADHRLNANGMRATAIDGFDKWLQERDGIAKQTASLPH